MSLAQTSDDSLTLILSFLMGKDITRLMATGQKAFVARVAHKTTRLDWLFSPTSYFPTCSYSFANLKTLIIKTDRDYAHLSLHNRSLLPLEPMFSLESLDLCFPTSHLVFQPPSSHRGVSMASSFPRLTSLSVSSDMVCPIPDGWTETLPQGLLALTMDINPSEDSSCFVDASSFEKLPVGLQHLEFGRLCHIGHGEINLKRFSDLRVLHFGISLGWDALKSLPDSLEELYIRFWNMDAPQATFPLSKLPPKIRALTLDGPMLELEFDSMAPATLEKVCFSLDEDVNPEQLAKYFYTKNLRVVQGVTPMTPQCLALLPNAEEISENLSSQFDTFDALPRKLKKLFLRRIRRAPSSSCKDLPPTLKELYFLLQALKTSLNSPDRFLTSECTNLPMLHL